MNPVDTGPRNNAGKNVVIVLALMAAGFFVGYLRFRPHLGLEMTYTDGERTYESGDAEAIRFAIWEEPEELSGAVNSPGQERRPAISPDGRLLVFAAGEPGLNTDLYVCELVDGEPVDPRPLTALNTPYDECSPAFGDGALYFASARPGEQDEGQGGLDLWRAEYSAGSFGIAENLGPDINTDADERDPAPLPEAGALAFASNGPIGKATDDFDLFLALLRMDGAGYNTEPLVALNSPFEEREPAFTSDGSTVLFASDRAARGRLPVNRPGLMADAVDYDLYRSVLEFGAWLPPAPVAGLNTDASERDPWPSQDGFSLLYSRTGPDGDANLWRARSLELFPVPGRPVGWLDLVVLATLLLLALLAFLAKRWQNLEVIYKCALVSLLIHLLLMWWFRHMHPESPEVELPGRDALFQVSLVASRSPSASATKERSGELESRSASESREAEESPERASLTELARDERAQDLQRAAARELERAEAASESAPAPREQEAPEPARAPAAVADAPELDRELDRSARFERMQGSAPEVALDAGESAQAPARERPADPGLAQTTSESQSAPSEARVSSAALDIQAAPESGAQAARPEAAEVARSSASPASSSGAVSLQAPSEIVARRAEDAPSMSLEASATGARAERTADDEARARQPMALVGAPSSQSASRPTASSELELTRHEVVSSTGAPAPDSNARRSGRAPGEFASVELEDGEREAPRGEAAQTPTLASESETWLSGATASSSRPQDRGGASAPERIETGRARPGEMPARRPDHLGTGLELGASAEHTGSNGAPAGDASEWSRPAREQREVLVQAPGGGAETGAESSEATEQSGTEPMGDIAPLASSFERTRDSLSGELAPRRFGGEARTGPERLRPAPGLVADGRSPESEDRPRFEPLAAGQPGDALRGDAPGRLDHTPYRSRFGFEREQALEQHGGGVETEAAVAAGLAYLARIQHEAGYWGNPDDYDNKYGHVSVGKTGLSLLAFLGAGHSPGSRTEHADVTRRAIDFLLEVQVEESGHFGYSSSYSHGIATYALAECYALTRDERLREPIEQAVEHILEKQHRSGGQRRFGGWGYYYPDERTYDSWPRVSVTAWQIMALESAKLGGIEIPGEVFIGAKQFVQRAWDDGHGAFRYSHDPQRLNSNYPILPGSTPAALFVLSIMGEDIGGRDYAEGREFLMERVPRAYRFTGDDDFVFRASGNLYFWYYSTLAMFRAGGPQWERWNRRMKATLLPSQETRGRNAGSWAPISIYARQYAGDDGRDRSYSTAMGVLTLEIYYRYFTPLLKVE